MARAKVGSGSWARCQGLDARSRTWRGVGVGEQGPIVVEVGEEGVQLSEVGDEAAPAEEAVLGQVDIVLALELTGGIGEIRDPELRLPARRRSRAGGRW